MTLMFRRTRRHRVMHMERDTVRVDDARLLEMERIDAGEYPGVTLVGVDELASQPDAPHGVNPELVDPGDER